MGADLTDILGTDRAVNTHDEAYRVIEAALERHNGPCPEAYADVLSAYVAATIFGRANLFLEAALRAFGPQPAPAPAPKPSEPTDDRVSVATAWDAEGRTVEWRFLTPEEAKAMDANKAARDAEANEKAARDRAFTEAFERISTQGIRDAVEVNRSALSGQRFPLDAEQIVRLTGAVLTRVLNASRPADSRAVEEEDLTVALGDAAGVPLPIARNEWGILRLQPYGTVTEPTKDEPASQQPGGSREG